MIIKKAKKKLHRRGDAAQDELQQWIAWGETVRELRCNSLMISMMDGGYKCCELLHILASNNQGVCDENSTFQCLLMGIKKRGAFCTPLKGRCDQYRGGDRLVTLNSMHPLCHR